MNIAKIIQRWICKNKVENGDAKPSNKAVGVAKCEKHKKQSAVGKTKWAADLRGNQYLFSYCRKEYKPASNQHVVLPLSEEGMRRVKKAAFLPNGKPKLLFVRKTVDDILSRTVPEGKVKLENGNNHKMIWDRYYSRNLAYVLYALGFNDRGVVGSTWMWRNRKDIEKFLSYMTEIGCFYESDSETKEFTRMTWGCVKSASWLLYYAGCYRKLPKEQKITDDLFRHAETRANMEVINKVLGVDGKKKSRYDRPPSAPQVTYANDMYFALYNAGYVVEKPNLSSFGSVGKFIGKWQDRFHALDGKFRRRNGKR